MTDIAELIVLALIQLGLYLLIAYLCTYFHSWWPVLLLILESINYERNKKPKVDAEEESLR